MDQDYKILTGRTTEHLSSFQDVQVHKECVHDLEELEQVLRVEEVQFSIASGFRSYERQLLIWNEKAEGKRNLLDKNGNKLNYNKLSEQEILSAILSWSAIPGASRHHWGTDFDVYDLTHFGPNNPLKLTCEEYLDQKSPCYKLHLYLTDHSKTFYRPYMSGNHGIQREPWHISHSPTASKIAPKYTYEVFKQNLKDSNFAFIETLKKNPDFYFNNFFLV